MNRMILVSLATGLSLSAAIVAAQPRAAVAYSISSYEYCNGKSVRECNEVVVGDPDTGMVLSRRTCAPRAWLNTLTPAELAACCYCKCVQEDEEQKEGSAPTVAVLSQAPDTLYLHLMTPPEGVDLASFNAYLDRMLQLYQKGWGIVALFQSRSVPGMHHDGIPAPNQVGLLKKTLVKLLMEEPMDDAISFRPVDIAAVHGQTFGVQDDAPAVAGTAVAGSPSVAGSVAPVEPAAPVADSLITSAVSDGTESDGMLAK